MKPLTSQMPTTTLLAIRNLCRCGLALAIALIPALAFGHTIEGSDANFVQAIDGPAVAPFMYLGAKHMVTGYDHLLFLVGVIFFCIAPSTLWNT